MCFGGCNTDTSCFKGYSFGVLKVFHTQVLNKEWDIIAQADVQGLVKVMMSAIDGITLS